MNTYWRLLGFAKPIEKYAIPYFFYTLFYTIFYTFTFMLIMPLLNTLFVEDPTARAGDRAAVVRVEYGLFLGASSTF